MSDPPPLDEAAERPVERQTEEETLELALEDSLDFLEGLLEAMELEGDVHADVVDGRIEARVEGRDAGLLIGRRGQTLDAIQEVLRIAIRHQGKMAVPINLDIEGYRQRRRVTLEQEARHAASRALEEGEVELDPMPAHERKIVHDAVAEIEGVTSFSEGEEPRRRVVIARAGGDPKEETS